MCIEAILSDCEDYGDDSDGNRTYFFLKGRAKVDLLKLFYASRKEWAKGLVGERMIEQFIHAHGEYLPTLCEDSGQPEWNVGEVRRFAKGLYSLFTKAIEGGE